MRDASVLCHIQQSTCHQDQVCLTFKPTLPCLLCYLGMWICSSAYWASNRDHHHPSHFSHFSWCFKNGWWWLQYLDQILGFRMLFLSYQLLPIVHVVSLSIGWYQHYQQDDGLISDSTSFVPFVSCHFLYFQKSKFANSGMAILHPWSVVLLNKLTGIPVPLPQVW